MPRQGEYRWNPPLAAVVVRCRRRAGSSFVPIPGMTPFWPLVAAFRADRLRKMKSAGSRKKPLPLWMVGVQNRNTVIRGLVREDDDQPAFAVTLRIYRVGFPAITKEQTLFRVVEKCALGRKEILPRKENPRALQEHGSILGDLSGGGSRCSDYHEDCFWPSVKELFKNFLPRSACLVSGTREVVDENDRVFPGQFQEWQFRTKNEQLVEAAISETIRHPKVMYHGIAAFSAAAGEAYEVPAPLPAGRETMPAGLRLQEIAELGLDLLRGQEDDRIKNPGRRGTMRTSELC
jgi:hypothetical protein